MEACTTATMGCPCRGMNMLLLVTQVAWYVDTYPVTINLFGSNHLFSRFFLEFEGKTQNFEYFSSLVHRSEHATGYSLFDLHVQGNPKTGVIFEGVPNLDHTQDFVRNDLKDWMRWVRNDLGFTDFRFDFSKGYIAHTYD
jgi:hypothetical protein